MPRKTLRSRRARRMENVCHGTQELLYAQWFLEQSVDPVFAFSAGQTAGVAGPGNDEYPDIGQSRQLANEMQDGPAISVAQHQIEQDHRRPHLRQSGYRARHARGGEHGIARLFEQLLKDLPAIRIILHEKDPTLAGRVHRLHRRHRCRGNDAQMDLKAPAFARFADQFDSPAVLLNDPGGDRQAEAAASRPPGQGPGAIERIENALPVRLRDARAMIGDGDHREARGAGGDLDLDRLAGGAVVNRVLHYIANGLGDAVSVAANIRLGAGRNQQPHARLIRGVGKRLNHLLSELLQSEGPLIQLHPTMLQPGDEEQVVDHTQQAVGISLAYLEGIELAVGDLSELPPFEHVQIRLDRRKRVFEVVRYVREQRLAVLLQTL